MTFLTDFLLTIALQILCFSGGCWAAWKAGKPLPKEGHRVLRFIPLIFLYVAATSAVDVLWPEPKYSHPYFLMHQTGDAVLGLIAAGLAAIYARVAPAIFAAGAKQHPAPTVILSASQIHLRKRIRAATEKQALPLLALGIGVGVVAIFCGSQAQNGEWIAFGFLGIAIWGIAVSVLMERQVRTTVKKLESKDS